MRPVDEQVLEMMEHYGGSFTQALAEACRRADDRNFIRIQQAFPELFEEYRELVRLRAANYAKR